MDTKVRALICIASTFFTSFIFQQAFTTSILLSLSLYFFLESYQLKAVKNSHLFIKTQEHVTRTEVREEGVATDLLVQIEHREAESMTEPKTEKIGQTMTEVKAEQKVEETMTEVKKFAEASTSQHVQLESHGFSTSFQGKDFSDQAGIGLSLSCCSLAGVFIPGKVVKKRNAVIQAEYFTKNSSSETEKIETREVDVQVWLSQDDQEVNTTQSLLKPTVQDEPIQKSGSLEVIHDDYYLKEVMLGELLHERETSKTGQVNYLFKSHLETELNVSSPFEYPPYCISLIDWTRTGLTQSNFELLKGRFQNSERVVKIRVNDFTAIDFNNFLDDPDFQYLFFGVYCNLLSNAALYIVQPSYSEGLIEALRIKWVVLKDFSPLFFLHTSDLEESIQEFNRVIKEHLGIHGKVVKNKLAFFDEGLQIYHLESTRNSSFNYIEEKIINFDLFKNFIRDEFDFTEFCKQHLKKTLKLIIKSDSSNTKSNFALEDYGFNITVKYKKLLEPPSSIIQKVQKNPSILKVSSLNLKSASIESSFEFSFKAEDFSEKPLSCLFISLTDISFSDLFGPSKHLSNFLEIYCKVTYSDFKDELLPQLSAWVLASHLSDFILLVIDFDQMPDLHHSDLILKFFTLLRSSEKPLYVLHKTSPFITYSYSFSRIIELLENIWPSDKVLLHEEIGESVSQNSAKLEAIKDQMNDNLFDPESHFNLVQACKEAFEAALEQLVLVQNTRKKELSPETEAEVQDERIVARCELEPTWQTEVRVPFQQSSLKNIIYVSPALYHIDQNISSTIYSTLVPNIQDDVVKVAVFSNLAIDKLSHVYLNELGFLFSQNKEDTLIMFPSSRQFITQASNHLNNEEFNSVFLHKFIEKLSDCIVISVFYEKGKVIEGFDRFNGLSHALAGRSTNKPVLVLHHLNEDCDLYEFFLKAIREFDSKLVSWTKGTALGEIRIIENLNEGLYAFDKEKQVIHRLFSSNYEVICKWYNAVLYKIMHNAAKKNTVKPLVVATQAAFEETVKETVLIFDDENVVEPNVQVSDYMEKSWKAVSRFSFKVYAEVLPLWTITSRI